MNLKEQAFQILKEAIEIVKPDKLIENNVKLKGSHLIVKGERFDLSRYKRIHIVGAGKASALMAQKLEEILGDGLVGGLVIVKYNHSVPCRKVKILEAGHPILDEAGLATSQELLRLVDDLSEEDLVICVISGGGSALLEVLPSGITLTDLQQTFKLLLDSGATIDEVNTVRKHLSQVKGGRLAKRIYPATCVSLILSDVIGDPLEFIASGPTAPDPTTFNDAWRIIEKYGLVDKLPEPVKEYLQQGLQGEIPETLKPGDRIFEKVKNFIIGNNLLALQKAAEKAEELGYHSLILSSRVQGEAREVARMFVGIVQEVWYNKTPIARPACVLFGGETTVTVTGNGLGGRNQELALAALISMKNEKFPYIIVSCGTDGTDGPTDAAGGFAMPEIYQKALEANLDPEIFLKNNDAYHFLEKTGGLIKTGPTGTNVMDIVFALIP